MRKLTRTLLLGVVVVLTLGLAAPAYAGPARPVPIKGSLAGTEMRIPADGWNNFPAATTSAFVVDGQTYTCSQPADTLVVGEMVGAMSHVGKVTRKNWGCARHDMSTGEVTFSDFGLELIAANGDSLYTADEEFVDLAIGDTWAEWTATAEFAGGTERFDSAAGDFIETGEASFPEFLSFIAENPGEPWTWQISIWWSGEIAYNASDRADR